MSTKIIQPIWILNVFRREQRFPKKLNNLKDIRPNIHRTLIATARMSDDWKYSLNVVIVKIKRRKY